jgi:hypothetical protein
MKRQFSISLTAATAVSLLSIACAPLAPTRVDHEIVVELAKNAEEELCPSKVVPPSSASCVGSEPAKDGQTACVMKGKSIAWTSTSAFSVHFDPLDEGRTLDARCREGVCKTKTLKIKDKAPPAANDLIDEVEYKYTVTAPACRRPLDPGIFIHR